MPATGSVMHLHLRYRLWIAEMNAAINVLRIFNDYLLEMEAKQLPPVVMKGIANFKNRFASLRKEIDELSHEMHLIKMKLAAAARENKPLDKKSAREDNHRGLKKRYSVFRKTFNRLKKEFAQFEGKWLR